MRSHNMLNIPGNTAGDSCGANRCLIDAMLKRSCWHVPQMPPITAIPLASVANPEEAQCVYVDL